MQDLRIDRKRLLLFFAYVTAIDQPNTQEACIFVNGDVTMSCTRLDIICDISSSIRIVDAVCGIRHDIEFGCLRLSNDCKDYNDCCRNANGHKPGLMLDLFIVNLSRNCSYQRECHVYVPVNQSPQAEITIQYCLVHYRCVSETTTASDTGIDRGTSTASNTVSWSSTIQNTILAETKKYLTNLCEPTGVPMVAVVVPIALILICVGVAIFMFCRKRRKANERGMVVDSNYNDLQRNPTEAINSYETMSYVVDNQSEPNDIVRYNGHTSIFQDSTNTIDGLSLGIESETYINIGTEQVPKPGQRRRSSI